MIAKHDLIASLMNILSDSVGCRDGAGGIPSAITTEGGSSTSSSSASSSRSFDLKKGEDNISRSIWEHAAQLKNFAEVKAK